MTFDFRLKTGQDPIAVGLQMPDSCVSFDYFVLTSHFSIHTTDADYQANPDPPSVPFAGG